MAGTPHTHVDGDGAGTWRDPDHLREHLETVHGRRYLAPWDKLPGIHATQHDVARLAGTADQRTA